MPSTRDFPELEAETLFQFELEDEVVAGDQSVGVLACARSRRSTNGCPSQRQDGEGAGGQEMLLGAAVMRPFMRHGADDAGLAVFPVHRLDAGHVAQLRFDAVGGDQQACLSVTPSARWTVTPAPPVSKPMHRDALDDVDAEFAGAPAQRAVEHLVGHHVCERLAGRHLAIEGQEDRAHRVGGARIGNDHLGDRLRLRRDLVPSSRAGRACGRRPRRWPRRGRPFARRRRARRRRARRRGSAAPASAQRPRRGRHSRRRRPERRAPDRFSLPSCPSILLPCPFGRLP